MPVEHHSRQDNDGEGTGTNDGKHDLGGSQKYYYKN